MHPPSAAQFSLTIAALCIGCSSGSEGNDQTAKQESNGWNIERSATREIENFTFQFPGEGFAYEHRDSLVDVCMSAIHRNMELLGVDTFSVPYVIRFYPSKAAMKEATGIGVSGQADFATKSVGLVVTNNPEIVKKENIVTPPIAHEAMHMLAMETWGYPPESNLWLNEGLATYATNSCNGLTVREVNSYLLANNMTFSGDSLVEHFYACDEMIAYHQAACYVQYLMEHYGVEKVGALWKAGMSDFEEIYGLPFKELEALVMAEVVEAYPNGVEIDRETFAMGCK